MHIYKFHETKVLPFFRYFVQFDLSIKNKLRLFMLNQTRGNRYLIQIPPPPQFLDQKWGEGVFDFAEILQFSNLGDKIFGKYLGHNGPSGR